MLLYRLKWRGLLGYKRRDQMLLESTHNLSTRFGIKKIRANDYYLFKRKPPSVSNFVITRPAVKSAVCHPKNMYSMLLSLAKLTILALLNLQVFSTIFTSQHVWTRAPDVQHHCKIQARINETNVELSPSPKKQV